jgi:NAD-dependent dihydropyrimidine dehydrogenase PreA subunit
MAAVVNKERCIACGTCVEFCPAGAITITDVAQVDRSKCVECGTCMNVCPNGAIILEGKFAGRSPGVQHPAGRYFRRPAFFRGSPPFQRGNWCHSGIAQEKVFLRERLFFLKQRIEAVENRLNRLEKQLD